MDESVVTIASGNVGLHGVLHSPDEPVGGLVLCHPFAEEKKCAHRTLVDLARGCVEVGWAALRFDMRGCGDSPGDFGEADLDDWRADISAATEMLAGELGRPVGLAGLRLGATLAAQVAGKRDDIVCLALLEPVVSGKRYIQDNLRRSIIKAMLTKRDGGEQFAGAAATDDGDAVDFDGYPVSAAMQAQIKSADLLAAALSYAGRTLVLNLSASGQVSEQLRALTEAFAEGSALAIRQEPVWQRIGLMDATPTIEAVTDWLQQF